MRSRRDLARRNQFERTHMFAACMPRACACMHNPALLSARTAAKNRHRHDTRRTAPRSREEITRRRAGSLSGRAGGGALTFARNLSSRSTSAADGASFAPLRAPHHV
jgi:hypothetical protein